MSYRIPVVKVQLVRERTLHTEVLQIRCAKDAADLLQAYLEGVDREHGVVLILDTKHKVRRIQTVSIGSLDASILHPREILKVAILGNASGIILGHNHPSGDPEPSPEDEIISQRLAKACQLMGIDFLDHLILGDGGVVSLKERGLF
ncbi:DNA repair protein RadC [Alicyclobacillaceae bacterium I2511]|nr:DNA repair protein RadC [Alicyclobacillaceae bacterium I2511]